MTRSKQYRCDGCGQRRVNVEAVADGRDLCRECRIKLAGSEKAQKLDALVSKVRESETPGEEFRPTFCAQEYANQADPKDRFILVAAEHHGWNNGWSAAASQAESGIAARDRRIEELEAALKNLLGALSQDGVDPDGNESSSFMDAEDKALEILRAGGRE